MTRPLPQDPGSPFRGELSAKPTEGVPVRKENPMKIPQTPFSTHLSGSAKETQLRLRSIFQWKKHRPPVWLFTLIVVVLLGCFGLVSCRTEEPTTPVENPTGSAAAQPTEPAAEPVGVGLAKPGLTLDDVGEGDDEVRLESYPSMEDWVESYVLLSVRLGTGEELTCRWDSTRAYPNLSVARLMDPDRDCIVVELDDMTSTYGASTTFVLEVSDGQLLECLRFDGVSGTYVEGDTLRLAQLVSKWLQPEYYTARWNGVSFDITPDGYLHHDERLEWFGASGEQGELTLRLTIPTGEEDFPRVDKVQLLRGEEVLQTIDPADYGPFYANSYATQVPLQFDDLNFDGHPDLGILCDESVSAYHRWFLWDPAASRFAFLGTLSLDLTADETVWQLRETLGAQTNYYCVSQTGTLLQLLAPAAEPDPRFAAQSAAFEAVLREKATVLDASDSYRARKITHTADGNAFTPAYFSVVDMDGEGAPEVVLWMTLPGNSYVGFDILRWEEGKIVSYSQVYRGLMGLKQDGTFSFSSGASDHGYGRMALMSETGCMIEEIIWCLPADNADGVLCFVEGVETDRAGFNTAIALQDEKPSVVWYELTQDNIALLDGLLAAAAE